jgi:hypothetical protein
MKIIVSHDVDHITVREHLLKDLYIQKWLLKCALYGAFGKIDPCLALRRMCAVFGARLNRVAEVMETDRQFGIPSTFFVGMANGLGLSYSLPAAAAMVNMIRQDGFQVGVHGIAYAEGDAIREERARFCRVRQGETDFGIRNHYLRATPETASLQALAGYAFDSSEYGLREPYLVGGLVEFPVCLMDAYLLSLGRNDLEDVKRRTLAAIEQGRERNLSHFTIIFHDCYYSGLFPDHRAWYDWLVRYVSDHYEVTDFAAALHEIKTKQSCA